MGEGQHTQVHLCDEQDKPARMWSSQRKKQRKPVSFALSSSPCQLWAQLWPGTAGSAELLWASVSLYRRWEKPSNVCSADLGLEA